MQIIRNRDFTNSYKMSMKNILVIAVLMIVWIQNQVQAETMRGVKIPDLDITRMVGDWYLLAVSRHLNELSCVKSTIAKQSDKSYTMITTVTRTAESIKENPNIPNSRTLEPVTCTKEKDSKIMHCTNAEKGSMSLIHIDIDYDSYAVGYTTDGVDDMATNTDGSISILGRQKTIPEGVLEKVKQSDFYKRGLGPKPEMFIANTDGCK